jgi:predicted chitinase
MGFSNSSPSLAAVLHTSSKVTLILVMCMGRHRGLLDSMKDQEEIEYSAQTLIDSWRKIAIHERQQRKRMKINKQIPSISINVTTPTPPLSTRF